MTRSLSLATWRYSIEPGMGKHVKGYEFLSFVRNFSYKYRKKLWDTKLDALETASKTAVHGEPEITDELIENKIAGACSS